MKRVEAVFEKGVLPEVEAALIEQGYPRATVVEVRGLGKGRQSYLKLEVVVANDHACRVAHAITRIAGADTGEERVLISPLDHF